MDTLKLILADDEPLFRNGISFILQREKDIEVIFEASDGAELLEYLKAGKQQPDIIIMDLKMPLLNGVDATKIISEEFPEIKIIALTSYNTKLFIANMINTGAASYLVKNTTPQNLLTTIREVAFKGFYYDEHVLEVLKDEMHTLKKSSFDNWELTAREREIIKLICMQLSTKEIADKLFINHRTVEGHRNNLLLKTQSKNMAGLVVFALQNDIIQLQDLVN
jgi:DNA-binding NarL/FixJ family response regulator